MSDGLQSPGAREVGFFHDFLIVPFSKRTHLKGGREYLVVCINTQVLRYGKTVLTQITMNVGTHPSCGVTAPNSVFAGQQKRILHFPGNILMTTSQTYQSIP